MDTRTRMLEAAEWLLRTSPDRDISTRAVCDAVGVGAPVLYRLFGDKNGLLAAVVDNAFDRYLTLKRAIPLSDDPVDDLYVAWRNHVAFASENPAVYRIAYAPSLAEVPRGVEEGRRLLIERLVRCAQAGRLNTTPDRAAQAMMAAGVGVNLSVLSQPATYGDVALARRVGNAVIRGLLTKPTAPAADQQTDALRTAALQVAALIRTTPTPLTDAESTLMLQWLDMVTAAGDFGVPMRPEDAELAR
jgi:AcrR family transcriptional regulator